MIQYPSIVKLRGDLVDKRIGKAIFLCYSILMLWLLFGQRMGDAANAPYMEQLTANMNLEPFRTIRNYLSVAQWTRDPGLFRHIVINLVGNVVMFIPLGFFLPLNWQRLRSFPGMIASVFLLVTGIEIVQLVTLLGSLDVDDLILNLFGASVGYLFWQMKQTQR